MFFANRERKLAEHRLLCISPVFTSNSIPVYSRYRGRGNKFQCRPLIDRYFQEETELPVSGGCRSMSGTRMSQLGTGSGSGSGTVTGTGVGGCRNRSYRFRSPGAPVVRVQPLSRHPAEPRLTIIDFNQLTRGGLELATSKNRAKVARKAAKPRR